MNRTIKAIEHHMIRRPKDLVIQPLGHKLFGEWQQRGPETLSGHTLLKLRLALAPPQPVIAASAAG